MDLEFELDYIDEEDNCILYRVKRKGLQIGTLSLNADPYSRPEARKKLMTMHNEIKRGE